MLLQLFISLYPSTGKLSTTQLASQFYRPPLVLPSQLAAPALNSTAQLYSKIQNLKQQRKVFSGQGDNVQHTRSQFSVPSEDSKSLNDLGDLQEVMRQKPLKVSVSQCSLTNQIHFYKKWVWLARLYWMKKAKVLQIRPSLVPRLSPCSSKKSKGKGSYRYSVLQAIES